MLRTKCIKDKNRPRSEDGLRVSIMSRHTLSDGVTPDPEISPASFEEWWRELAPPPRLIGAYYRSEIMWREFEAGFSKHLAEFPPAQTRLRQLVAMAKVRDVTIMCVEPTPEKCHRRLVAEAARALDPELQVVIE